ncbi:hypothetical protein KY311_03825, partial [Candidatus Woesearchaeota archaeon]|nr:hypothetical protein [Candidatus Woesearchaeota archaeon]
MKYDLHLIDETDESYEQLEKMAQALASQVTAGKGYKSDPTKRTKMEWLSHDLQHLRSWNILQDIDGYALKDKNQRTEVRIWSRDTFSVQQLEQMFNIIVNGALFARKKNAPGYFHGHSIVYKAVATNKESMFYNSIPFDLHKRLHNGTFWEAVSDGKLADIEHILMHHFESLDVSFLPRGLEMFSRNLGQHRFNSL